VEGKLSVGRDPLEIQPRGPLEARVEVPGSKSDTNRALVLAALARGESELLGALDADDTSAMRDCLAGLGVAIEEREPTRWRVHGCGGALAAPRQGLDVRASGTTARFVTAVATLAPGTTRIDGTARMRERPIDDLVHALRELGATIEIEGQRGCPPLRVQGGGLRGGRATIDASRSSQYVSAILLVAPYAELDLELHLKCGVLVSRPYVDLTLRAMRSFGAEAGWRGDAELFVRAGLGYRGRAYRIEPDASSAAYVFTAAAVAGGRVRVPGLPADSAQPDLRLLDRLAEMGCRVSRRGDEVELAGPTGKLRALDVDMNESPDAVVALAVACLFADGPSTIRNVAQLRLHETDRLAALETELRRLGARAEAGPDWLRVEPGPLHGAEIETYDDHRMAMSFALAGLRVPGVAIRDPACVAKTWPDYFSMLERL
jgi:3-phosphoshikimate 1-carboxyvinyltransferase